MLGVSTTEIHDKSEISVLVHCIYNFLLFSNHFSCLFLVVPHLSTMVFVSIVFISILQCSLYSCRAFSCLCRPMGEDARIASYIKGSFDDVQLHPSNKHCYCLKRKSLPSPVGTRFLGSAPPGNLFSPRVDFRPAGNSGGLNSCRRNYPAPSPTERCRHKIGPAPLS